MLSLVEMDLPDDLQASWVDVSIHESSFAQLSNSDSSYSLRSGYDALDSSRYKENVSSADENEFQNGCTAYLIVNPIEPRSHQEQECTSDTSMRTRVLNQAFLAFKA